VSRCAAALRALRRGRRLIEPLRVSMPGWLRARLRSWLWVRPAPLPPKLRRDLTVKCAEDIQLLSQLIQRDLGHWLADNSSP
jgi:hypothetical protein